MHELLRPYRKRRGRAWWRDCFRLILGADGHFYNCEGALLFPYGKIQATHSIGRARENAVDWNARQKVMDASEKTLKKLDAEENWQFVCPRLYCSAMPLLGEKPDEAVANLHRASTIFLKAFVQLADELKGNASFARAYLTKVIDTPG